MIIGLMNQNYKSRWIYLEANPDYGLVHTEYDILIEKTGERILNQHACRSDKIPQDDVYEQLLYANFIANCTVCFRRDLFEAYVDYEFFVKQNLKTIDFPISLEIAKHSKVGYIDESTAIHRVLEESLSNTKDPQKIYDFFIQSGR